MKETSKRLRYSLGGASRYCMRFESITDAKDYLLKHKQDYIASNGIRYKVVPIFCGFKCVGRYTYIKELRRIVKVGD